MRKERVILSLKAKDFLKGIISYLKKEASIEIAEYVRKGIIEKCKDLNDFSGFAKERYLVDLPEEYRSVRKWDYIIIFSVKDKEIRVLNIIHSHRHPNKRKDI